MIYTITFSPSIDYIPFVENFKIAELNRASDVRYFAGGKGINISRVLTSMTVNTTALGFIGGFTGAFIENALTNNHVRNDFIKIAEPTRINVKIKSDVETDLNGPTPYLTEEELDILKIQLANKIQREDWLIISGSIPMSIPNSFFEYISNLCEEKQAKWVLDTSGPRLVTLLPFRPYMIKPNEDELAELVGQKSEELHEIVTVSKKIVAAGVALVIVSLGGAGAVCVTDELQLHVEAPQGKVINTVGAGDSVVAGVVAQLAQGNRMEDAIKYGIAAGSATAFHEDLCTKEQVEQLLDHVIVSDI
ncbi:1-phosphofructokinase [Kurthia sibirica]|uniref:Tagatose-6-phosphate kinase n=1 Tax=Kurthia sibirica TaxID=202750 RepID=A0A2U3AJQ0_9BACL|nr:1-phosphofructokinase [Kurthia sibirica]PWI24773.1 1-phosphofructokinase [Kurthia sibirica]GEK34873.1 tagatose-6-phosphate kinase [Kurthia sibirica]